MNRGTFVVALNYLNTSYKAAKQQTIPSIAIIRTLLKMAIVPMSWREGKQVPR
jgi:hypothetical protein